MSVYSNSYVSIHIGQLNIFGLISSWGFISPLGDSILVNIRIIIPLYDASDDESLPQNILKGGVDNAVYEKIGTRVEDDKKLVDGDSYLDPCLAVITATFFPNFFESSEINKLIYVKYDSQRMAHNKYYNNPKQNECLFNIISIVSPFSTRWRIRALRWLSLPKALQGCVDSGT